MDKIFKKCLNCNIVFGKGFRRSNPSWALAKYCCCKCFREKKSFKGNKLRLGLISPFKGKKHTEETKQKISKTKKGSIPWNKFGLGYEKMKERMSGANNPAWIEDRNALAKKQIRNDYSYIDWRRNVWLRDNFKCRIANQNCNGRIEAHHILGWTLYPELRYEINNGITLCHAHHPRKRVEEQQLALMFQELIRKD